MAKGDARRAIPPPLIVHAPEVARGLARRYGMAHLVGHPSERLVWAAFTFTNSFLTITILAGLAMIVRAPFAFPSLGPHEPSAMVSTVDLPRVLAAALSLGLTGVLMMPSKRFIPLRAPQH